ncbi:MAG: alpha-1,2-fucosyltransferase [Methylococcales bacterium]
MVISHILGGIGNQMFQYAAGRALSLTHGSELLSDLHDFSDYSLHNGYELNKVFNINIKCASEETVKALLKWRANSLIMKVLRRPQFSCLRGQSLIVEPYFSYWPELLGVTSDCYLYGYWQSELYFKLFESTLRNDFTFREPLDKKNSMLVTEIERNKSVSLHIRRGDYISDTKTNNIMNVCSLNYYYQAVKYISQRVNNPIFYIFSDDIEWVKKELSIDFPCVYVEHNQQSKSYRDMQLMSLCKHNVIANSSFSWWGAWLNANLDKQVVAPISWFNEGVDDRDLIPREWVRL